MTAGIFQWQRAARNWPTLITVAAIWIVLAFAAFVLDAVWWVIAIVALFTLPALYDLGRNPVAGVRLDAYTLSWFSGKARAEVALAEIDHIRLDTRLDFSVRASVVLTSGRKVRLPFEATPPHQMLEDALSARGVAVQRHHFSLRQ